MSPTDVRLWRKKPIEVEVAGPITFDNYKAIAEWCGGRGHRPAEMDNDGWCSGDPVVSIETLDGTMDGQLGDFVVKGAVGEFYPIKPAAAAATFEGDER